MKFILAKKEEMTRIFAKDGTAHAGTILVTDKIVVTQVKTKDGKDKYAAVQIGFGERKTKNVSKAVLGHTKGKGYQTIREFRLPEGSSEQEQVAGNEISADIFEVGETVRVSGHTKGKGFAGGVKRHGFHGGPRSHGQKHSEREPGAIGGSGGRAGGRVAKGIRMAGRMGGVKVTVENLKILAVDAKAGKIIVSGAVPGPRGTILEVTSVPALKHGRSK